MDAGQGLFQIRLYDPIRREAAAFQVVAEIEMPSDQASKVNVALCSAGADVRFWPMTKPPEKPSEPHVKGTKP